MSRKIETSEDLVARLVLEYALSIPQAGPLAPELSLRRDLAIESLSLVSLALRLGEELGIDLVESGIEFGKLDTVGDLVSVARDLAARAADESIKIIDKSQIP